MHLCSRERSDHDRRADAASTTCTPLLSPPHFLLVLTDCSRSRGMSLGSIAPSEQPLLPAEAGCNERPCPPAVREYSRTSRVQSAHDTLGSFRLANDLLLSVPISPMPLPTPCPPVLFVATRPGVSLLPTEVTHSICLASVDAPLRTPRFLPRLAFG